MMVKQSIKHIGVIFIFITMSFGPNPLQAQVKTDTDVDGVLDKDDKCPTEAGPIENNGCPWPDDDGDGVSDKDDQCPDAPGTFANHGCPSMTDETRNQLNAYARTILFDTGKSSIKPESTEVMIDIAQILQEYPNAEFIIEGHTDNIGSESINQKLSEERANTVRDFLIQAGIETHRLSSIGYGESKPISTNNTQSGRIQNRRVEINLTNQMDNLDDLDYLTKANANRFEISNKDIFSPLADFQGQSIYEQYTATSQEFTRWKKNYFEDFSDNTSLYYDDKEDFLETDTPDGTSSSIKAQNHIELNVPIIIDNKDTINVKFGTTASDGKNSNQKISSLLNSGIGEVLKSTNNMLKKNRIPPISTIYIMCTTNGKHSKTSNHYSGLAMDISRLNNVKIVDTRFSYQLSRLIKSKLEEEMEKNPGNTTIVVEGHKYDMDLIYLHDRVEALQLAIEKLNNRRENFGPLFKTKYSKENPYRKVNYFYPISGHEDHIHFSVR